MRIGIVQCITSSDDSALRYLLLSINSLQTAFQLEFVPFDREDSFLKPLLGEGPARRPSVAEMAAFHRRQSEYFNEVARNYEQQGEPPRVYQVISEARFTDSYFYTSIGSVSVMALGNWKRAMAPPSILEFIYVLVLQSALVALCPNLNTHLGTRGCLMDFSAELSDARQKVLASHICHECESVISGNGYPVLVSELRPLLTKSWLGSLAEPTSPATIMLKLKRGLFITKGLEPTWSERIRITLLQEGVKQALAVIGIVLAAALIYLLGVVTVVRLIQPTANSSSSKPTVTHGIVAPSPTRRQP